jgi:hypothetical protein
MRPLGALGLLLITYGVVAVVYHAIVYRAGLATDEPLFAVDLNRPITIVMNPLIGVTAAILGCLLVVASRRPRYA